MAAIKYQELKRLYEAEGPAKACNRISGYIERKELRPEEFSIRDLCEALVPDGREFVRLMSNRKSGGISLLEAAHAVDTTAFSNITGQLVFNKILERYNDPQFLWPELCETINTTLLDGEKIPGIGRLGDEAEVVDEGQPYPKVGLAEEYVETAPTKKRGFIVPVTREIIVADRTGILLRNAGEGGYWLGVNKEKRVIDVVTGQVNNYKRNGTTHNTYLTSGAWVNSQVNVLTDWTDIENAELLFDAITDPNTGEPIDLSGTAILVPTALKYTASQIANATQVWSVDTTATVVRSVRSAGANPITNAYKILSSPLVKARTNSASTWFLGDFKRAFAYIEVWGIETMQAPSNSEAEFDKDIMMRFKVTERGVAQAMEPRRSVKNTAS